MTEPSRVLFVLHRGGRAGTERHVLWLAKGLRERGWSVHLAVSDDGPILPEFLDAGVTVHRVARRGATDPAYPCILARLARSLAADVLHAHSGRTAALAGRIAGVPRIVETRHGLGPKPRAAIEARLCRLAHHTLTVCESDRARLIAGGLEPTRVTAVPNGIPIPPAVPDVPISSSSPRSEADPIRLGFLGRLTAQKNPLFLADVALSLERRAPGRWTLAIAGDGPLRGDLERRLTEAGCVRGVRWLGETCGPAALLAACDYLCLPSVWEGQPLAVLEAMAVGVLPITNPLPSLVELLGGVGGGESAGVLLALDAAEWAGELISLHESPARRMAMAGEARRRIEEEHEIAPMVNRIEEIYRATDAFASGVER